MLKVNEIFGPTIQGEGKSLGKEVIFLRLTNCNLHCVWCDTPYTWNWEGTTFKHPEKFSQLKETHEMDWKDVFQRIQHLGVKAVVISGGEPLLQQKQLLPLLAVLKVEGYWVEVETNGTVRPLPEFLELVDQVNCSPKLSNSGDSLSLREKGRTLEILSRSDKTNFKFVVSSEKDIEEIQSLVARFNMNLVYLMPEGRTPEELSAHKDLVEGLCKVNGFIFTNREHIVRFGPKRGV